MLCVGKGLVRLLPTSISPLIALVVRLLVISAFTFCEIDLSAHRFGAPAGRSLWIIYSCAIKVNGAMRPEGLSCLTPLYFRWRQTGLAAHIEEKVHWKTVFVKSKNTGQKRATCKKGGLGIVACCSIFF